MPAGVIARLVGAALFVLAILGGALYFTHLGKKLEQQNALIQQQTHELEVRTKNEKKLTAAIEEQTEATAAARAAAQVANALAEEVLNRPRPVHTVPVEHVVEVVRAGDCDRAALDAWDLLEEKGVMKWNTTSTGHSAEYWRDYYLDYARHAPQPQPVQVNIHVPQPLNPGLTGWRSPHPGLNSNLSPMLNSGLEISAEIQLPRTVPR
jgi:hypothetical protein